MQEMMFLVVCCYSCCPCFHLQYSSILLYALVEVSLVCAAPDVALVYAIHVEFSLVCDAVPVDAALVDAFLSIM